VGVFVAILKKAPAGSRETVLLIDVDFCLGTCELNGSLDEAQVAARIKTGEAKLERHTIVTVAKT
jgi:hypothetical protein